MPRTLWALLAVALAALAILGLDRFLPTGNSTNVAPMSIAAEPPPIVRTHQPQEFMGEFVNTEFKLPVDNPWPVRTCFDPVEKVGWCDSADLAEYCLEAGESTTMTVRLRLPPREVHSELTFTLRSKTGARVVHRVDVFLAPYVCLEKDLLDLDLGTITVGEGLYRKEPVILAALVNGGPKPVIDSVEMGPQMPLTASIVEAGDYRPAPAKRGLRALAKLVIAGDGKQTVPGDYSGDMQIRYHVGEQSFSKSMPWHCRVVAPLIASPGRVYIRVADGGEKSSYTFPFVIQSRQGQAATFKAAHCDNPAVTVTGLSSEPRVSHAFTVHVNVSAQTATGLDWLEMLFTRGEADVAVRLPVAIMVADGVVANGGSP